MSKKRQHMNEKYDDGSVVRIIMLISAGKHEDVMEV